VASSLPGSCLTTKRGRNAWGRPNVPACLELARRRADTEHVGTALELVAAILLPTALGCLVLGTARAFRWLTERRRARSVPLEPVEQLGADLRRLHAQLEATENQPPTPGKAVRVRAIRAAYVDAVCAACQRLEITAPAPGHEHVPLAEIYRLEADLRLRGLDVRQIIAH
jgi:hypothetical protein